MHGKVRHEGKMLSQGWLARIGRWLFWPAIVLLALNIETLGQKLGYDKLLADAVDNRWAVVSWLGATFQSNVFENIVVLFAGAGGLAWLDWIVTRAREWVASDYDAFETARKLLKSLNAITAKSLSDSSLTLVHEAWEVVKSDMEAYDLQLPDLPDLNDEQALMRFHRYVGAMHYFLHSDSIEHARALSKLLEPSLSDNADGEQKLLPPSATAPSAQVSFVSTNVRQSGPHYEYPKAVLQMQPPKISKLARGGGELTAIEAVMSVRSECYMELKKCQIHLLTLEAHGISQTIDRPMTKEFAVLQGETRNFKFLTRDLADTVSKPPFLLNTVSGKIPLEDNTSYLMEIELRSEAQDVTIVHMGIVVHEGAGLDLILADQSVKPR